MAKASKTFEERNAQYKDNWKIVGAVMEAFFPDGIELRTKEDHEVYHLFELLVVKLTRFVTSEFTHIDSIHDPAVYAAMIESILTNRSNEDGNE